MLVQRPKTPHPRLSDSTEPTGKQRGRRMGSREGSVASISDLLCKKTGACGDARKVASNRLVQEETASTLPSAKTEGGMLSHPLGHKAGGNESWIARHWQPAPAIGSTEWERDVRASAIRKKNEKTGSQQSQFQQARQTRIPPVSDPPMTPHREATATAFALYMKSDAP